MTEVGDYVKIKHCYNNKYIGKTGVVIYKGEAINSKDKCLYEIKIKDNNVIAVLYRSEFKQLTSDEVMIEEL